MTTKGRRRPRARRGTACAAARTRRSAFRSAVAALAYSILSISSALSPRSSVAGGGAFVVVVALPPPRYGRPRRRRRRRGPSPPLASEARLPLPPEADPALSAAAFAVPIGRTAAGGRELVRPKGLRPPPPRTGRAPSSSSSRARPLHLLSLDRAEGSRTRRYSSAARLDRDGDGDGDGDGVLACRDVDGALSRLISPAPDSYEILLRAVRGLADAATAMGRLGDGSGDRRTAIEGARRDVAEVAGTLIKGGYGVLLVGREGPAERSGGAAAPIEWQICRKGGRSASSSGADGGRWSHFISGDDAPGCPSTLQLAHEALDLTIDASTRNIDVDRGEMDEIVRRAKVRKSQGYKISPLSVAPPPPPLVLHG